MPISTSAAAMTAALMALDTVGEVEVFKTESSTHREWLIRFYSEGDPAHIGAQPFVTVNASTVRVGGARRRRLAALALVVDSVAEGSSSLAVGNVSQADDVTANSNVSEAVAVTPVVHVCGNGVRSSAEACDDNNTIGADGCDSLCQLESGFACTSSTQGGGGSGDGSGVGGLDTCAAVCGDGKRISWGGEGCDDNNTAAGDGCSAGCAIEPGFSCTGGSVSSSDACASVCGDGLRVGPEACDDGGLVAGDGCSAACVIEVGYTCAGGGNASADACVSCHASCASCAGGAPTDCTACAASHPFANNVSPAGTMACVADCTPLGKYANGTAQACAACDSTCTTCSGPSSAECLSCAAEAHPFLHGATCVAACPEQGFYVAVRGDGQATCAACAASCLSCSGPSSTDCLSCPATLTPHLDDGACVAACPDSKHLDDYSGGASTCAVCHATCRTCSGAGNASCLTCTPGVTFSAGACVSSCATVRLVDPRCLHPYFGRLRLLHPACNPLSTHAPTLPVCRNLPPLTPSLHPRALIPRPPPPSAGPIRE